MSSVSASHTIRPSSHRLVGIGKFTLLDPAMTEGSDVGNNFFLEPSSIGKPRAAEVTRFLLELNSDVTGLANVKVSSPGGGLGLVGARGCDR